MTEVPVGEGLQVLGRAGGRAILADREMHRQLEECKAL